VNVSLSLARPVPLTPITLPLKEARRRFTDAGLSLAQAGAEDQAADPLRLPVAVYEDLARYHRRAAEIDPSYDPAKHRYVGDCGC
jgi:hypothetical protein